MELLTEIDAESKTLKRFCVVFGVLLFLGLATVWTLSYIVDPYGIRPDSLLPPIEESSRFMKMRLLREAPKDTQVLILGSSRQLRVLPPVVEGILDKPTFNAAVSSGGPEDAFALTRFAREAVGLPINEIIFGIDVDRFSPHNPLRADFIDNPELLKYIDREFVEAPRPPVFLAGLSGSRLHLSVKALEKHFDGGIPERDRHYLADGSRINDKAERELADGTFDFEKRIRYDQKLYRGICRDFTRLDPQRVKSLIGFMEYCEREKIKVTLYLTPSHPRLLEVLKAETHYFERLADLKAIIAPLAEAKGFRFVDVTHIESFGGDPNAYYDGIHAWDVNSTKLMRWLLAETKP